MLRMRMYVLLVLGVSVVSASVNGREGRANSVWAPKDWYVTKAGSATNCDSPKNNFTLNWDPAVVRVGNTEIINFDFTPGVDFNGEGMAYFTVWLPQSPDPIYKGDSHVQCNDIKRFMPALCPLTKGNRVQIKNFKFPVVPTIALPQGTFHAKIRLVNKDKQNVICVELTLTVQD